MKAIDDFYQCIRNFSNELIPRYHKGEFTYDEWKRLTATYNQELAEFAGELIGLRNTNDPEVLYVLGEAYTYGRGVEENRYLGTLYMAEAANAGNCNAMVWIGKKLIYSEGATRDGEIEALSWILKAANQGSSRAMFELGIMYRDSRGVAGDGNKAVEWLSKAIEAGDEGAKMFLAKVYFYHLHEPDKALPIFLEEAAKGKSDAHLPLGQIYSDNSSHLFNYDQALYWLNKVIEANSGSSNRARIIIAKMNLSRVHRPRNVQLAMELLEEVVSNSPNKTEFLKEALKLLREIEKDEGIIISSIPRKTPSPKITLRAVWANDDADSSIEISPRQWKKIQEGEALKKNGWGTYEGQRFSVRWCFLNRKVSIYADEQELIINDPLENLFVRTAVNASS